MSVIERINDVGYDLIPAVFSRAEIDSILTEWDRLTRDNPSLCLLRTDDGAIYGARNVLELWPEIASIILKPAIRDILVSILGAGVGLVRVLFFDKPPNHSWALPWHRDLRIAVKDNSTPDPEFSKPTLKYGVPHLEAPHWLLEQMLTARLHLDPTTDANGPLKVIPGSHRDNAIPTESGSNRDDLR